MAKTTTYIYIFLKCHDSCVYHMIAKSWLKKSDTYNADVSNNDAANTKRTIYNLFLGLLLSLMMIFYEVFVRTDSLLCSSRTSCTRWTE